MHEAGLARAFAAEVERRGLEDAYLRVFLTGGHADGERFEAAFRAHLGGAARWYDADRLEVVREPGLHVCSACASPFEPLTEEATCPYCGGLPLPGPAARLEFEALVPASEGAAHVP